MPCIDRDRHRRTPTLRLAAFWTDTESPTCFWRRQPPDWRQKTTKRGRQWQNGKEKQRRKEGRKKEGKRRMRGIAPVIWEECTRGHILLSTAVAWLVLHSLFFLSSLVLQWKCPMLGDRRNGRRVKSSKLWPQNQTMTSPKEPMRLSQLIKTWPFCRNSLWSRRRTDCRCVIYIWDVCQKWIYGFLLYVKKKKRIVELNQTVKG